MNALNSNLAINARRPQRVAGLGRYLKKMLPVFTYHPHPLETGAIKASDATCECCSKARGFVYTASIYCADEVECVCPWCIADGSAAEKFDGKGFRAAVYGCSKPFFYGNNLTAETQRALRKIIFSKE